MLSALAGCTASPDLPVKGDNPVPDGAGVTVEIYFSSQETPGDQLTQLVNDTLARFPRADVSLHDYSLTSNYRRMREMEKLAGLETYAPVEAFVMSGSGRPIVLAGESTVIDTLHALIETASTTDTSAAAPKELLDCARTYLPDANSIAPLSQNYLYRIVSGDEILGYLAEVKAASDCQICRDARFMVIFDKTPSLLAVQPLDTVLENGRPVDLGLLSNSIRGVSDPSDLLPSAASRHPLLIPDAPETSRIYLNGIRTALMDLKSVIGTGK